MIFTLNNGHTIPAVGLGTWRAKQDEVYKAVLKALAVGYQHIDTAVIYGNEEEVGRGIVDSSVSRDTIYLTSKVWNTIHTTDAAARQIDESLQRLKTDYLDLMLIHWPGSYERNAAVWAAMEDAVDAGKIRSIGVSNFNIHHIDALLGSARIKPTVNQMECHINLQNVRLQDYLTGNGMVLEAYAPFKSDRIKDVLDNKTLKEIGSSRGKTPTQVVVRWLMQRGVVALPKSVTPSRIEENFQVFDFELSADEMKEIRKLNKAERTFPEPDNVDFGFASL
ncbi:MAG: aldo/keto reductase [Spirochaetaceae bacterium]